MTKKIITTIGPGGWEAFGRRFVQSFKLHWPQDIQLEVWHHDLGDDVPSYPGVSFRNLNDVPAFAEVTAKMPAGEDGTKQINYHFKVIALAAAVDQSLDWIAALDADTETMQPVEEWLLDELFDSNYDLTYLYRRANQKSEGSWTAFNLKTVEGASLLADYYGIYVSGEFLHYKNPHDNAVLDRLVTIHRAHNLKVKNLSEGALGLDAFHQSPLAASLVHYKGPDKNKISNPGLGVPSRYEMLCNVVKHCVKETGRADLVEVGTWNGGRAVQMAEAAFEAGAKVVTYVGFDTFDGGTDRARESHEKPDAALNIVDARLRNYAEVVSRQGKRFEHRLVRGNTLETLPASKHLVENAVFAYIDGGHSYETVKSDYEQLKHVPCIVFDDVIHSENPAASVGPRKVFEEVAEPKKVLMRSPDRQFIGGVVVGEISLGAIYKEPVAPMMMRTPIQVKPVDSVDKGEQLQHVEENTAAIKEWLDFSQAHTKVALLVSAGPTLSKHLKEIKKKQKQGAVVFAVKHAYPALIKANIRPDFTVVLDPRPVDGISTHGVLRKELFAEMGPADKVLLATMTHPSVRRELEEKKARLIGWHAHTNASQNAQPEAFKVGMLVAGGTCAATRMPMLAYTMGFRRLEFYGYDFYYEADVDKNAVKQSLMTVAIGEEGKQFLTTGELIAAMQDLGQWNRWMVQQRLGVTFHGDGAAAHVWRSTVKGYENPKEYPY